MPSATMRSAALSESGKVGGGSRKLSTATSSAPTFMRVARRPRGTGAGRSVLGPRERGMTYILAHVAHVGARGQSRRVEKAIRESESSCSNERQCALFVPGWS